MTRLVTILSIGFALILATSCSDWLEIKPESEIVLEDYWQNETQVTEELSACYRAMTESDYMARVMVWGELRSDNVTSGNSVPDNMSSILTVDITSDNEYCDWSSMYEAINICNTFLYYAPEVVEQDENFTESELHSLEAEVLTLRAISYFYLIRTFKEVPWVEDASIDDTQEYAIAASPDSLILSNLIDDLTTALTYARDYFETTEYTKGRITKNAVRAVLADIYLWQEDYDNCIKMCDEILTDNQQSLELVSGEDVLTEVFYDGNSSESIFELQFDDDLQDNTTVQNFLGYSGDITGYWSFPDAIVNSTSNPFGYKVGTNEESEEDIRETDFLLMLTGAEKYYAFKYAGSVRTETSSGSYSYAYGSKTPNWIVYRLSEIYLMEAEALIEQGNYSDAMDLINVTYLRSNTELSEDDALSVSDYNSKSLMESLLLRERQREFVFEGRRWFTLMRLALRAESTAPLLSYVMKKYSGTASIQAAKMTVMNALYLPISTDELSANPELEQNPYYEVTGAE